MLLACYTPYSFSSAIFGTIEPTADLIRKARGAWLDEDIIEAMDPDLHRQIIADSDAEIQIEILFQYFKNIYAATLYTEFSPRQQHVLLSILNSQSITLKIINAFSSNRHTNPFADRVTRIFYSGRFNSDASTTSNTSTLLSTEPFTSFTTTEQHLFDVTLSRKNWD